MNEGNIFPREAYSTHKGFTIIELLIVFSVMAIISSVGVASFVSYTNSQSLRNTALSLKTVLQEARSESSSQVTTSSCPGAFQGYEVRLCHASGLSCPACLSAGDYELDTLCSSSPNQVNVSSYKYPTGVSLSNVGTTQCSFRFIPITGGITGGGSIVLLGANNATQTITVTSTGVIQ